MQELVWSNLPWDWNLRDDVGVEGINEDGCGWKGITGNEEQLNGDYQPRQAETMGMSIL